eukprot:TRINITY_DN25344_c0_g1_i1.p1 TRINITY_DN25344_c0_g1~~TRINITY_DN25344_c0_g1_i1.p1  ORF type:complete len:387 (-),score=72.64 TRINITY_DN25344_c0_g1_i1:99-1259(-)
MLDEAEQLAREAVKLSPWNATQYVGLAEILTATNEHRQAEKVLAEAVELSPRDPDAWHQLGYARAMQGNYEIAKQDLEKAVALRPLLSEIHLSLGSVLGNLGQLAHSELALAKAWKLGDHEYAEDQLQKLWRREGRILPNSSAWVQALTHEQKALEGESLEEVAKQLVRLRDHKAGDGWWRSRIYACAHNGPAVACSEQVLFLEAWQQLWPQVEALVARPQGRHAVLGGGTGAMCLFVTQLANSSGCLSYESCCDLAYIAAQAGGPDGMEGIDFGCESKDLIAGETAVAWVLDAEVPAEQQEATEAIVATSLPMDAVLVLFREPRSLNSALPQWRLLANFTLEPTCIGTINDKCHAWRPLVSWGAGRNLTVYVLQVLQDAARSLEL